MCLSSLFFSYVCNRHISTCSYQYRIELPIQLSLSDSTFHVCFIVYGSPHISEEISTGKTSVCSPALHMPSVRGSSTQQGHSTGLC